MYYEAPTYPTCYLTPENFYTPEHRRDVFEACKATAEYSFTNNIEAVAFIDRAARPMWVGFREYWQSHHDKECPALFFLDPKGFCRGQQDSTTSSGLDIAHQDLPKLWGFRDRAVLIVDTCIHSGGTIKPVLGSLSKAGFGNVHFGVVYDYHNNSSINPDLVMLDHDPEGGCHPFGSYGNVTKHSNEHLYPEALQHYPGQTRDARAVRRQIRNIIKEFTKQEKRLPKTLGQLACH